MSTVDFGDKYPVTEGGRAVAIVLMFFGIVLFALIAASLASFFLGKKREEEVDPMVAEIRERLDRIEQASERLGGQGGHSPTTTHHRQEAGTRDHVGWNPNTQRAGQWGFRLVARRARSAPQGMSVWAVSSTLQSQPERPACNSGYPRWRLDPRNGRVLARIPVLGSPVGIAVVNGQIWVTVQAA